MKELTTEEKAKLYDEAKARMSKAYNSNRCTLGFMNEIFPELIKPEGERIRKAIIEQLKSRGQGSFAGYPMPTILAWLEKQGQTFTKKEVDDAYLAGVRDTKQELEKQGEQKSCSWKPTKEQFEALDYAYNSCSDTERGNYYEGVLETLIEDLHRLEKQNPIMAKSPQLGEQTPTRSEEDSVRLQRIIDFLWYNRKGDIDTIYQQEQDIDWLKSLKQRIKL